MVKNPSRGMFRSLRGYNYRLWACGALVSNIGTWMQRIAQDWIVLTQLTHHNASAVGIVMACQFGPPVLLLPLSGYAADHFDRRKLLMCTQAAQALLALGLGLLTLSGAVQLWHVYVFALLLGCVTAFDSPARQTFVADLVGEKDLANAVALNSTSFNSARMIGPAVAGLLIALIGSGWLFLINALSFVGVIAALSALRVEQLYQRDKTDHAPGSLGEGFRYVWRRPDLKTILFMLLLVGTFGLNFPIFISTMSVTVFHGAADQYGLLTSCMAIGSVMGALLAAKRSNTSIAILVMSSLGFALSCITAAVMPSEWLFGLILVFIGITAQTFTTSTNSLVQLSTTPAMRGRVLAIWLAIAIGNAPLGAPVTGWMVDTFGPRWALAAGGSAGFGAALVGLYCLIKYRKLRLQRRAGRWQMTILDESE